LPAANSFTPCRSVAACPGQAQEPRRDQEPPWHQSALFSRREDFGKGVAFKPQRLFRMARSKAYLFGGVEIRWSCAPQLIKDDTPAEAVFHFPGGLKEYLEATIEGQTRVTKEVFAGRIEKEGGHGSVEWAACWVADETAS
jgi:DNA gyrase/topoisomerase IV subunit B